MSEEKKVEKKSFEPKYIKRDQFLKQYSHLFSKRPKKTSRIINDPIKKDLTRFVKWPKYVRIQRQARIIRERLKAPSAIAQFNSPINSNLAKTLFGLLIKYVPETKAQKKERLLSIAREESKVAPPKSCIKFGLNHVVSLIERKKAKLVVIANDVNPIELVVFIPLLCRKMGIPYCIAKSKERLGALVHMKTASCIALTDFSTASKRHIPTVGVKSMHKQKKAEIERLHEAIRG